MVNKEKIYFKNVTLLKLSNLVRIIFAPPGKSAKLFKMAASERTRECARSLIIMTSAVRMLNYTKCVILNICESFITRAQDQL